MKRVRPDEGSRYSSTHSRRVGVPALADCRASHTSEHRGHSDAIDELAELADTGLVLERLRSRGRADPELGPPGDSAVCYPSVFKHSP